MVVFFFSSRRRHTRWTGDWSSDVCSSDLVDRAAVREPGQKISPGELAAERDAGGVGREIGELSCGGFQEGERVGDPGCLEECPTEGGGRAGYRGPIVDAPPRHHRRPKV